MQLDSREFYPPHKVVTVIALLKNIPFCNHKVRRLEISKLYNDISQIYILRAGEQDELIGSLKRIAHLTPTKHP